MGYIIWELPHLKIDQDYEKVVQEDNGEITFEFRGNGTVVHDIPLLYQTDGTPVPIVNNWLIYLKSSRNKKQVNTQAQAMLHYFSFLEELKMNWDDMPIIARKKPTYLFSKYMKDSVLTGGLARTTATNYLGCVVNFYKFYLSRGYNFSNQPFNYETIKINVSGSHSYMRGKAIHVDTTDLRLKLPHDSSHGGVSRKLIPLSIREWDSIDNLCGIDGKGITNLNNSSVPVNISIESKLAVYLARFSGLRRDEILSLRLMSIYKPDSYQMTQKYLIHTDGILLSPKLGVKTKGDVIRTVEIPTSLMVMLHNYINSNRYITRRKLYEVNYPKESNNPPILLTQKGKFYSSRTINARWGEIRNRVRDIYPNFNHKFHNLRSTYAVERLKELLNSGIKEGDALDYMQSVMGHRSRQTLLHYLKFCSNEISGNEVYEQALETILKG
jgi:integrase